MSDNIYAILLDTRSIQKYVFGSNKLKTNTGASYLVDGIFNEAMIDVLLESNLKMPAVSWQDADKLQMEQDASIEAEIGYIGGGNMLILVRKGTESLIICRQLVQRWSLKVLLNSPGLKTGAAIGEISLDKEEFQASLNKLYKQLKDNQNNIMPQVDLPYTGFTVECDYSGKAVNVFNKDYSRLVSAELEAKLGLILMLWTKIRRIIVKAWEIIISSVQSWKILVTRKAKATLALFILMVTIWV